MFKFEKEIVETTKGMQSSVYDELYPHFTQPGETLYFNEADMSRASASQAAKRLMKLDKASGFSNIFHSGWDAVKKKVYIRVRPQGEVPRPEEAETPELELPNE